MITNNPAIIYFNILDILQYIIRLTLEIRYNITNDN